MYKGFQIGDLEIQNRKSETDKPVNPVNLKYFLQSIFLIIFLVFAGRLEAQTPPWNWSTGWASNGDEIGRGVFVDSAGYTYQVGSFSGSVSSLPTMSTLVNSGAIGTLDIMVAKIDPFGVPVWLINAGGSGNDVAHCVTVDKSGNVYVGGFTQSSSCVFKGAVNVTLNASSSTDFFVAKFNSSGSVLWVKTGSGLGNDEVLALTNDNSYVYAGGYFSGNLTLPSSGGLSSTGGDDMFVIKYDLAGSVIWRKSEGGVGNDRCTGIAVNQSDIYICGSAGNGITYNGSPNVVKLPVGATGTDITLAKIDAGGDVVWGVSEGNTNNCSATSISVLKNNVVVGGTYVGLMVYNSNTVTASANNDMFFASYGRNGTFKSIWNGATAGDECVYGVSSDERFIYVAGKYANTVNFGGTSGVATSTSNLFMACYDSLFTLQFVKFAGGNSSKQALSLSSNQNGVVSTTGSYNGNSIQFAPLSALTNSVTEDLFVASLINCQIISSNTISASSTVCSGSSPPVFTVSTPFGGNSVFHYQWQQSANSTTWTAAAGTNTLINYAVPSLTQTTYYRRMVSSCTEVSFSNTLTITVVPPPTPASAGADQLSLCGVTSTTLAANTAAIGTGSWTVISGAGASFLSAINPTTTFNGTAGTTYTLRWTISNSPCAASFDDVNISFNQNPTTANAGLDQINLCGVTATTLTANTAAIGTGSWTVISGSGGSFLSATNPTTTFNGTPGTAYTLRWTISNNPCTATFDDVNITFNQNPSVSNAGLDQLNLCGVISTTLTANTPAVGTGSWTVISGSGGVFVSPTTATSTFNGLAANSYTLRWTISNAPCTASFDDVVIAFNQNPSLANAGVDQTVCVSSPTLSANTPTIGTGSWSVLAGTGGSFLSSANPTTTFNGVVGTNYTLRWTISNAPCTASFDDINITINPTSTLPNAGSDQTICASPLTLSANIITAGTGSWTVISGAGGSFVNDLNPTTSFNGLQGSVYVLRWSVSNPPCNVIFDDVTVTIGQNPTNANAGNDQPALCGVTSTTLSANAATVGTGVWTVLSGTGGSFLNAASPVSSFNGQAGATYTLQWTINNAPCPASSDDVVITFNQNPTTADAGNDQSICSFSTNLLANMPAVGTGSWTIQSGSGGSFANSLSAQSLFNGNAGTNYVLRWTVSNAVCPDSYDEVNINLIQNPTIANAGSDQTLCAVGATLSANTAVAGSGVWTVFSGTGGSFVNSLNPNSVFKGTEGTDYVLRWTISNAPCTDSYDEVSISFGQLPTKANSGTDRSICSTTVVLLANTPLFGSGHWKLISGTGSLSSSTAAAVSVSDLSVGLNEFTWEITAPACPASVDTIAVRVDALPTKANAGEDSETTLNTVELKANVAITGLGKWTLLGGVGSFANEKNPLSVFNFGADGTAYLIWTIENGVCPASSDTVIVVKNPLFVPELITPNGDGDNDNLMVNVAREVDNVKLEIFNRWGALVYSSKNYKNEFVGKNAEGVDLADDTYFVLLAIPDYKVHTSYLIIKRK